MILGLFYNTTTIPKHICPTPIITIVTIGLISQLKVAGELAATLLAAFDNKHCKMDFIVRRSTDPEEIRQLVSEKRALQGFRPGALDHKSYFAADENGFFIGEVGGKPISSISVVKHTEDCAFIGQFLVQEAYRSHSYGFKTWQLALEMASLQKDCNLGLDARLGTENMYAKSGFKSEWCVRRAEYIASEGTLVLKGFENLQNGKILQAREVQFQAIIEYDASIYGFSREKFLQKWICAPNSHSYVATAEDGTISGYVVIRTALKQDEGWRFGPLFADNCSIARSLYKAVFDRVSSEDQDAKMCADVPYGDITNQEAMLFVEEIPSTIIGMCTRMYTRGVPPRMLLQKIYAHTALEVF